MNIKRLFFFLFVFPVLAHAQVSGIQVGAVGLLYKQEGSAYGGQFLALAGISRTVSLGAGVETVQFKSESNSYIPVYAALQLHLPVNAFSLSADVYTGQGIYHKPETKGGFYWSSGFTISTRKRINPYISIHYTDYEYHDTTKLTYTTIIQTKGIQSLTIRAGVQVQIGRKRNTGN